MRLHLSNKNPTPYYLQIFEQVRQLILTGELSPGEALPSIRQLAQELFTSVITVKRAYQELEAVGLITTRPGLGTFVAEWDEEGRRSLALGAAREALSRAVREAKRLGLSPEEILRLVESLLTEEEV
ncbi:MAG TPA: GntR family transcriptional regulator [Firmicutes bacterium]|nr:GntR family transcriptional regulator [Candidatus Fermentithermobacillaceae bacterium]